MKIHGHYYEPEFLAWKNMLKRVFDPRYSPWYDHVKVWGDWAVSYDVFVRGVGRRPSKLFSLDRIDHRGHYAPGNVRWADKATQSRNTKNHCTNKTGVRGVSWSKAKQKWRAAIYVDNRQVHVGYFELLGDAASARAEAETKHWKGSR